MPWDASGIVAELDEALALAVEVDRGLDRSLIGSDLALRFRDETDELVTIVLGQEGTTLTMRIAIDSGQIGCDADQAATLLVVLTHRVGGAAIERVVLDTLEPIFRSQARRLGFEGGLRRPLVRASWLIDGSSSSGSTSEAVPLEVELSGLVPDLEIRRRSRGNALRQLARSATSVVKGIAEFDIVDTGGASPGFRLAVADRPDLLVESIAMSIDTLAGVRRALHPAADHIRKLSFAGSMYEFRSGKVAGAATMNLGHIDLNAGYVSADGVRRLRRQQRQRTGGDRVAGVPSTYSALDGIVAHECWHLIEAAMISGDFRRNMAFRREIGEYFGVDTLEQVTQGHESGASVAERTAHDRLVAEVSEYAATNPLEAAAEMFKLWWCAPPDASPVVTFFDGLLRRNFDIHR